ncbi:hypothetical protein BDV12DRAFT_203479 [Aspergillus spectabilis]
MPCQRCFAAGKVEECEYSYRPNSRPARESQNRPEQPIQPKATDPMDTLPHTATGKTSETTMPTETSDSKHRELRSGVVAFNSDTQAHQFYGPSSIFSFVQRLYQKIQTRGSMTLMLGTQKDIPEGVQQWGLEQQMFPKNDEYLKSCLKVYRDNVLPRHLGDAFISTYFAVLHPQAPILSEKEITGSWRDLFSPPRHDCAGRNNVAIERSILYMVLAIGACLSVNNSGEDFSFWAGLLFERQLLGGLF